VKAHYKTRDGRLVNPANQKATTWKELRAHHLRNRPTLAERRIAKPLKEIGFHRSVALYGYIADFYNPYVKLVVEIDGPYHSERLELDRFRDIHLASRGIHTLRFSNDYVFNCLPEALKTIRSAIHELKTLPDRSRAGGRCMEPSERSSSRESAGVTR